MNPLGSPEKDPLLQGDPLAPFADEESTPKEKSTSPERQREGPPTDEDTAAEEKKGSSSGKEPLPVMDEEQAPPAEESVSETNDQFPFEGEGTVRTVVRNFEEARSGNLTMLNAAFDQGWRLDQIVYRERSTDLLFVLRHEKGDLSHERIV